MHVTSLSGNISSPVLTDPDTRTALNLLDGLVRIRARAADTAGA
jgi:hypothetical protein